MNNLIWFRNDLRVTDNISLANASTGKKLIAVYCFDPRQYENGDFGFKKTEKFRAKFLLETVRNLRENLKKLHISLLVFHKKPEEVIPLLVEEYAIENIYLQKEWTRDEQHVLKKVRANMASSTKFIEAYTQFLFHPEDIPFNDFEQIPEVFTNFRKKCEKYSKVRSPIKSQIALSKDNTIANDTRIPTLEVLGFEDFPMDSRSAFPFKGGEHAALQRLQEYFWDSKNLARYKKTRNGLLGVDYSSKLSAWLANGSISAKTIYWEVRRFEEEVQKNQDTYWLIFELIWRDYFKYISLKHGHHIFRLGGILKKEYSWESSEEVKESWITGTTKESFVNANMKEIAQTGWMSNRGRQNVASFWSKELEQDWRIGAAYFESMLIDYDVHSNWGNWMYTSGVGNDPRDRKFNIARQAAMYDAKGNFQKLWLQNSLF